MAFENSLLISDQQLRPLFQDYLVQAFDFVLIVLESTLIQCT